MRNKTLAAAGLVLVARTYFHKRIGLHRSLGVVSRLTALDADRMDLCYELSHRKQVRHWTERFSGIVLVEAGHDHPYTAVSKLIRNGCDLRVKELSLVDPNNLRVIRYFAHYLCSGGYWFRVMFLTRMGCDLFNRITSVDNELKNLNFLTCDPRTVQPANQLFGFSREH